MKRIRFLSLSVLLLTVILGSAFSTQFATHYFTYSGTDEFQPSYYTLAGAQSTIPGPNIQLAWIQVDDSEIYPGSNAPMVDISSTIRSALIQALTNPKSDVIRNSPVIARVQLKP